MVPFFEVLTRRRKLDVGVELPLSWKFRPFAGSFVWLLLGAVLFLVLPGAYLADTGASIGDVLRSWWLLVVMAAGLVSAFFAFESLASSVRFEITPATVTVAARGMLGGRSWSEPLDRYAGLERAEIDHPDWIGAQKELGILLRHKSDDARSLPLYWGRDLARWNECARAYSQLLGLPVL